MTTFKFNNLEISVVDYVIFEESFIMDLCFDSSEKFKHFYRDLYLKKYKNSSTISFELENTTYTGYFGVIIYDSACNVRIYIQPNYDDTNKTGSVLHENLIPVLNNYEKRIAMLTRILYENGFLDEAQLKSLSSYLPYDDFGMDLSHQVRDLPQYLAENQITISELRQYFRE